jgi:hypothetical protein
MNTGILRKSLVVARIARPRSWLHAFAMVNRYAEPAVIAVMIGSLAATGARARQSYLTRRVRHEAD